MKKLFVLILLLFFSLPALAKEVRLTCTTDWNNTPAPGTHTYTLGFDEAAGTVLREDEWHSIKTKNSGSKNDHSDEYFITEQRFGYTSYYQGEARKTISVSRIDGTYSRSDYPKVTGTCVQSEMPKRLY